MKITTFILLVFLATISAYSQSFQWGTRMGGFVGDINQFTNDKVEEIEIDSLGNVYVCGEVMQFADFNATPVTTYGLRDIFIAKYNCNGNLLWVKTAGSHFDDYAYDMKLDGLGHIYLTGEIITQPTDPCNFFGDIVVLDGSTAYVTKLDTSGNVLWSKFAGPDSTHGIFAIGYDIELSPLGDLVVFFGVAQPGEIFPGINVVRGGYIFQFDTSGAIMNYGQFSVVDFVGEIADFKVNSNGDRILTGHFNSDSLVIQNQTLYNPKSGDIFFLAKFDSTNTLVWTYQFTDTLTTATGSYGYGLCTDAFNNIYVTGVVSPGLKAANHVFIDPFPPLSLIPIVVKVNNSGNAIWATQGFYKYNSYAKGKIDLNSQGHLFFSGSFGTQAVFGNDTLQGASLGLQDIFLAEADTSGNILGAVSILGTGSEDATFVTKVDYQDNVYVGGIFDGIITVNSNNLASVGGQNDAFIAKYGSVCITGIPSPEVTSKIDVLEVFPNPTSDYINIRVNIPLSNLQSTLQLYSINGVLVREIKTTNSNLKIDLQDLPPSMYLLKLTTSEGVYTKKVLVQ